MGEGAAEAERWVRDGVRRAVARARRLRASTYEERTECDRAMARHLEKFSQLRSIGTLVK